MPVFYPKAMASLIVVLEGQPDPTPLQLSVAANVQLITGVERAGQPLPVTAAPMSFSVNRNGYKEADTYEISFDAKLLPFSPDIIRSAAVEIYGWNAATAVQTQDEIRSAMVEENLLITGTVDEANIHFDGSGRTFRMAGRDLTALFLDNQWDPKHLIPVGADLKDTVQTLVDIASHVVEWGPNGTTIPTGRQRVFKVVTQDELDARLNTEVTAADNKNATGKKQKKKPKNPTKTPKTAVHYGKTNKKGVPVKTGSSFWDVIYRLVQQHGLITYVRGVNVIIAPPNVLTESSKGKALSVAYGRNLASLSIERKMGKQAVPVIKVLGYDRKNRRQLIGQFPTDAMLKSSAPIYPSVGTKKDEVLVTTSNTLTTQEALDDLAEARYRALARTEATVHFQTNDLKDLQGSNLLALQAGDPVGISFQDLHFEEFKTLNSTSQRRDALIKLGYRAGVAGQIAQAFETVLVEKTFFYTKEHAISYDHTRGYSFDVTAVNYISPARDDHA